MSEMDGETDPLDSLETHWKTVIADVRNQNLTPDMAKSILVQWRLAIDNFYQIQSKRCNYSKELQWEKIEQIEHFVTTALYKSVDNFRNNERIKLKECYGPIGEIIYFLKNLFGII